jgi:dipeptidyl aminopeptidase/acylaminoacyl peptidase
LGPAQGDFLVLSKDTGGGEFFQLYRFDLTRAGVALLTDGKSRNTGPRWSHHGKWLAYTSTRRNGKDNDVYIVDPSDAKSDHLLVEVEGGGWGVADWSDDDTQMLLLEYISANESYVHLVNVESGSKRLLTPKAGTNVSYAQAQFARDGSIFVSADKDSEFKRLVRLDLSTKTLAPLSLSIPWDVQEFELSPNGKILAFVSNENGSGILHLFDTAAGRELPTPQLPLGVVLNLKWHPNSRELGFNLTSARSPSDVYSLNVETKQVERWTESETGGLNATSFVEPELVRLKSFDGLSISAFLYRPDGSRFSGKRPVMIEIHGGPESQSRPAFLGRYNYLINELGIALIFPNVRGSSGYGKTFLTLDNGTKREDAVKDIGSILDWIQRDSQLDGDRVAVHGGSYGGYMTLASMARFNDRLRLGIDVVGISNFVTFLKNTQDYRRDLRRAEYGDEQEEAMRSFLERISPLTNAKRISKPLLVVQGKNDPRVPATESEQMVRAIRESGVPVWYLMAKDEGHGFAKKKNVDYEFYSMILFLKEYLLN